jgi:hypothetical protein
VKKEDKMLLTTYLIGSFAGVLLCKINIEGNIIASVCFQIAVFSGLYLVTEALITARSWR